MFGSFGERCWVPSKYAKVMKASSQKKSTKKPAVSHHLFGRGRAGPGGDDPLLQGAPLALAPVLCHVGVPAVLHLGVHEAIADADALQRDGEAFFPLGRHPQPVGDGGDIVPGIGLAEDVQRVGLVLGECVVEGLSKERQEGAVSVLVNKSTSTERQDVIRVCKKKPDSWEH